MTTPNSPLFASNAFDVSRAILRTTPVAQALTVQRVELLQDSLRNQTISPQTSLQVVEINNQPFGFVTRELLLFDVAQGASDGFEYLVTFCPICNAGALFSPKIDNLTFRFTAGGIYNAMAILRDLETDSFWDVVNGVCLHGSSQGKQLNRLATLRHMLAKDAVIAYPDIQLASLPLTQDDIESMDEDDQFRLAARPEWSSRLANTLTFEDTRLSRFDMGLGLWTPTTARYYPVLTLYDKDNVVFDSLDGQRIIVYVDPESHIPDAFYTVATEASRYGTSLRLNNGHTVDHGTVYDKDGHLIKVVRPLQLFQRWYAFAVMFRQCEIYGLA